MKPIHELTIADAMTTTLHTVNAEQNLKFALDRMQEHNIRHLPVLKGGKLIGILSERDIRFLESYEKIAPEQLIIEEAFTEGAYTVGPSTSLREVCADMSMKKISSALVLNQGELVGIFTWIDALKIIGDIRP
jgi:acetoin utilization protein AcuB